MSPISKKAKNGLTSWDAPVRVFISYSHKDENFRKDLETHLATLTKREMLIEIWHDRVLGPSPTDWRKHIDDNLGDAGIVLPLISPAFMDSDYCNDEEMKQALQRHGAGQCRILPILIQRTDLGNTSLAKIHPIPLNKVPIREWPSQDQAWCEVVSNLREAVMAIRLLRYRNFFSRFNELHDAFRNAAKDLTWVERSAIKEMDDNVVKGRLTIGVFGKVKAGKSTFVNALAGADLSPTRMETCTKTLIRVRHDWENRCTVIYKSKQTEAIETSKLGAWLSDRSAEELKRIDEVVVTTTSAILGYGGRLEVLDTPGFDGQNSSDTTKSLEQLKRTTVAIFVYRYPDPETEQFLGTLKALKEQRIPIIGVLNVDDTFRGFVQRRPTEAASWIEGVEAKIGHVCSPCLRIKVLKENDSIHDWSRDLLRLARPVTEAEELLRGVVLHMDVHTLRQRAKEGEQLVGRLRGACGAKNGELQPTVDAITSRISEIEAIRDRVCASARSVVQKLHAWRAALTPDEAVFAGGAGGAVIGGLGVLIFGGPVLWIVGGGAVAGAAFWHWYCRSDKDERYGEARTQWSEFQSTVRGAKALIEKAANDARDQQFKAEEFERVEKLMKEVEAAVKAAAERACAEQLEQPALKQHAMLVSFEPRLKGLALEFGRLDGDIASAWEDWQRRKKKNGDAGAF